MDLFHLPDSIFALTSELAKRGLSTKGLRNELQTRLLKAMRQEDISMHDEREAYVELMQEFI